MTSQPSHTETDPARVHRAAIVIEDELDDALDSSLPPLDPEAYQMLDEIARGGMGRILRARDRLGRIVAVKQLLDPSLHHIALFEREARITARLQHPSIVSVIEAGVLPDGQRVYVMKLVPGRSLKQVLREPKDVIDRLRNLPIIIAIADALAYAHAQGVIHRDLKPSNVLIGEFGEVVVIDWGLAHDSEHAGPSSPDGDPLDARRTDSSMVTARAMGTPAYMSPEAARGESVDGRADVYAIGAILYELLSGAVPYAGSGAEILAAVRSGPPVPIAETVPGTPVDLAAIVDKAMAHGRDARYPSAKELADELRRFATGQLVSAHAYSVRERLWRWVRRHRAPVAVAAAALVLTGTLTAIGVTRIIHERDVAAERAEQLTLTQARLELDRDPTAALTTLSALPPDSRSWSAARVIAADAMARGIPRHVRLARPIDAIAIVGGRPRAAVRTDDGIEIVEPGGTPDEQPIARIPGTPSIVALSADGSTLAAIDDGRLRAWRVADPSRPVFERAGPRLQAVLAVSMDGSVVAAAGSDTGLGAWQLADGREVVRDEQLREVTQLAAASDVVLATDTRGSVTSRAVAKQPSTEPHVVHAVRSIAVGRGIAIATTTQGELRLLDTSLAERRSLASGMTGTAVAVSPAGTLIAIAGETGIAVFDGNGTRLRTLAARRRPRAIAIDNDGTVALIEREHLLWWNAPSDRMPIESTRAATALALGLSARATRDDRAATWTPRTLATPLVFGGDDGSVWLTTRTAERRDAIRLGGHMAAVRAIAVSVDGSFAGTTGDDRAVRRWSLLAQQPSTLLGVHHAPGLAIAISPDGHVVASGGVDRLIQIWRDETGGAKPEGRDAAGDRVLGRHRGAIRDLAFSPDGYELVSIADDREAIVWSLVGRPERRLAHESPVTAVAWLADGSLVTGTRDGQVLWWARGASTSRVLATHAGAVRALATAGDRIATGGDDGRVGVGDSSSLDLKPGHTDLVRGLAFAADGRSLASASEDGNVRLWDPVTGESRAIVLGSWVADVAIGADGSVIAAGANGVWSITDDLPHDREALQRAIASRVEAGR